MTLTQHLPISGDCVSLRPKVMADAPLDYIWSKDKELAALNGQEPLTDSYISYITQYRDTSSIDQPQHKCVFSIKTTMDEQHIGNCTIYDIDWDNAEAHVGITIGDRRFWGQGYGEYAFKTLVGYAFHHLGMRRLNLKTLKSNLRAQKCFQKCGFNPCGSLLQRGQIYILMQLCFDDYVNHTLR